MEENFNLLKDRIFDTLISSDLISIRTMLNSIKGNTIIIGTGGSSVVATYASKIIDNTGVFSVRDLNYIDLSKVDNILIASYSGSGYVIESLIDKKKNIYLFTNGKEKYNVNYIKYFSTIKKEDSFISLASTLMPMSILLYCVNPMRLSAFLYEIENIFIKAKEINIHQNHVYEILTGYDFLTPSKFIETTMIESGIGIPIIHDKYDYCHGRSTTSYKNNHGLIIFDSEKELDNILKNILRDYYRETIVIEKYYPNDSLKYARLVNEYYATVKSMYLMKMLSENKSLDLSKVDYSPVVKKLYYFKGGM